jgi:23S rRNA (pseudouridine1915-N3)-methyltransferase
MWELMVITVGRISDANIRRGVERYASMLGGGWSLRFETVAPSRRREPGACRREEGEALLRRLPKDRLAVALHPEGERLTSEAFGARLARWKDEGRRAAFLIGGPHGLGDEVLSACRHRLALSDMTLPHELATLVLVEQIYRAQARYSGKAYAK